MDQEVLDLIAAWDGLGVVVRHDRPTGTWIFIALHDDRMGPPLGGTRMMVYPSLADALRDAQRLAEGMTYKWAGLGVPYGGGKAVLAPPAPLDDGARDGLLDRYGELVASLRGLFHTGPDLGITPEDMARIAARCPHVMGHDYAHGSGVDPGPFTARGVFEGLKAAVAVVFGTPDLAGRTVLVQGLGDVGAPLARLLAGEGARLLLTDLDDARAAELARELGGETVAAEAIFDTPCDVYAPCAVGAILNAETIPRLRCRVVAGSANNQLAEDEDAARLLARGIVYVPDYVINSGGAMAFALMADGVRDRDELMTRVAGLGTTVGDILRESRDGGVTPLDAARRRVERRMAAVETRG